MLSGSAGAAGSRACPLPRTPWGWPSPRVATVPGKCCQPGPVRDLLPTGFDHEACNLAALRAINRL